MLRRVDLPEPELPRRAKNSPPRISRETWFTARITVAPKRYSRVRFSVWMRGAAVGIVELSPMILRQGEQGSYALGRVREAVAVEQAGAELCTSRLRRFEMGRSSAAPLHFQVGQGIGALGHRRREDRSTLGR